MDKKTQLRTIEAFYQRLSRVLERSREDGRYYDLCLEEEREHRRADAVLGMGRKWGVPVKVVAQYYYARNVLWYLAGEKPPSAADYWWIKKSVLGGYALWHQYEAEIRAAFTEDEARLFCSDAIDYCALVGAP